MNTVGDTAKRTPVLQPVIHLFRAMNYYKKKRNVCLSTSKLLKDFILNATATMELPAALTVASPLRQAFRALIDEGIATSLNSGCCYDCAVRELREEFEDTHDGYAFANVADTHHAVKTGDLFISYGCFPLA